MSMIPGPRAFVWKKLRFCADVTFRGTTANGEGGRPPVPRVASDHKQSDMHKSSRLSAGGVSRVHDRAPAWRHSSKSAAPAPPSSLISPHLKEEDEEEAKQRQPGWPARPKGKGHVSSAYDERLAYCMLRFMRGTLDELQGQVQGHSITMATAVPHVRGGAAHELARDPAVSVVVANFKIWYKHRENLIVLFRRYLKLDEHAAEDVRNLSAFLDYLKSWNQKPMEEVGRHRMWRPVDEHVPTLNVLYERQHSEVFLCIWYDKRHDIEEVERKNVEIENAQLAAQAAARAAARAAAAERARERAEEEEDGDEQDHSIPDLFGAGVVDDEPAPQPKVFAWTIPMYTVELFRHSCAVCAGGDLSELKIADLDWFIDLDLSNELQRMDLVPDVIRRVHLNAGDALKLAPLVRFAGGLIAVVELVVDNMAKMAAKRKASAPQLPVQDANWEALVRKFEEGTQLRREQPIASAATMYDAMTRAIGITFTTLHRNWLLTFLDNKHIVEAMATNDDFADTSRFEEMLRLLDDGNNAMMAQLSGALRSVKRLLRSEKFANYTALMRRLAGLLRDQDLMDLAQVRVAAEH